MRIHETGGWLGIMAGAVRRIRQSGIVGALRYAVARKTIARRLREAERVLRTHNEFLFGELGISREAADQLSRELCAQIVLSGIDVHVQATAGCQSFHFTAFAALRCAGFRPRNVLEIGTYLGYTTSYLSRLFPEARIFTVALPPDDPVFDEYHRQEQAAVRSILDKRLDRSNITLLQMNSAFLWQAELPELDLIWLDGGHQFPVVAWDHFYSLSKLAPGGWLFSDDVYIPAPDLPTPPEGKMHPFYVTEYYNCRNDTKFRYLLKREEPSSYLNARKFIACYRRCP